MAKSKKIRNNKGSQRQPACKLFIAQWDMVSVKKYSLQIADQIGVSPDNEPVIAYHLCNDDMSSQIYAGNLVLSARYGVISKHQKYGVRIQVVMRDPAGKLHLIDDNSFALSGQVSLATLIYGGDAGEDDDIYMNHGSGLKSRFTGLYTDAEKVFKEYLDAGWSHHSMKVQARCRAIPRIQWDGLTTDRQAYLAKSEKLLQPYDQFFAFNGA